MLKITKQYKFCAAHRYWNSKWDEETNYKHFDDDIKLHGHNYELDITIKGPINPETGFIINIHSLNDIVKNKVLNIMDHSQIEQDIEWFIGKQPSTENMVIFIWEQIVNDIHSPAKLFSIKLRETQTIFAEYFGPKE